MKNIKNILLSIFVVCFVFLGISCGKTKSEPINPNYNTDIGTLYLGEFDKTKPFFEEIFTSIAIDNNESINSEYDKFKIVNNKNNFQGLETSVYQNINGKTVEVEGFYRKKNEALNDPNVGFGLMLYQCIQYKIQNPTEEVSISFSTYRCSVTTAVCIDPESRYYGYMRSLYSCNYDNHGFVRISYMLVEAARMGINVTIVGQLNSYAVKQYNASGKLEKRQELSYIKYFNEALESDCYDKYENGHKVADFLNIKTVEWTIHDKGSTDMMHVKACAISNYIDKNGEEKGPAVWFSSSNLDAIDYKGCNGNNGDQSGVIVSGHDKLYKITDNYIKLMAEYYEQEKLYELRNLVTERNFLQAQMIRNGLEKDIPENEQIIYLGSGSDSIFELYFTPLGSYVDTWDIENNPYCKYVAKLAKSEDYIIFAWNNPTYNSDFFVSNTMHKFVDKAFNENKNSKNRIAIYVSNYDFSNLENLVVGKEIGYKVLKNSKLPVHSKDMMLSYMENSKRYYTSIISSCNFHLGALSYQTNSTLVINETDETGNGFFRSFGDASSYGAVKDEKTTMNFSGNERFFLEDKFNDMPLTFEAVINVPKNMNSSVGVMLGDNDSYSKCITYEIYKNGQPRVYFRGENKKIFDCIFDKVDVRSDKFIHLAIVHDYEKGEIHCYINGKNKQTLENAPKEKFIPKHSFVIGGDFRRANYKYFKGSMKSVALWSDVRTAKEIKSDYTKLNINDENLMMAFDLSKAINSTFDLSKNNIFLKRNKLWLDSVDDVGDYAYSMAVVGDTQELSEKYPQQLASLYDWIVDNKEKQKIEYVMGLGDITQKSKDEEWTYAKEQIYKLNDIVPYSVIRGNHDKIDGFNKTFNDGIYNKQITGSFKENDLTNTYSIFKIGNTNYLLMCLDYGPTDEALEWANEIISSFKDHKVIITTHTYLYRDGTTFDENDAYSASKYGGVNDGDDIWDKLVSKHENILLVLSGHDPWDSIVCTQTKGDYGNIVTQMLIDPQNIDYSLGGTAMVAMLYFSEDGQTMTVRYYSVTREQYGSASSQFTINLN